MLRGFSFCVLMLMSSQIGAVTQSPQAWTTNVVPGEFKTKEAALSAVRAQGGAYALAERVESVRQTESTTTYQYGSNPSPVATGDWSYTAQFALSNPHASEQGAIGSVDRPEFHRHSAAALRVAPLKLYW